MAAHRMRREEDKRERQDAERERFELMLRLKVREGVLCFIVANCVFKVISVSSHIDHCGHIHYHECKNTGISTIGCVGFYIMCGKIDKDKSSL